MHILSTNIEAMQFKNYFECCIKYVTSRFIQGPVALVLGNTFHAPFISSATWVKKACYLYRAFEYSCNCLRLWYQSISHIAANRLLLVNFIESGDRMKLPTYNTPSVCIICLYNSHHIYIYIYIYIRTQLDDEQYLITSLYKTFVMTRSLLERIATLN